MCGIAGFIDHHLNSQEQSQQLTAMLKSIAHRGPDGSGQFFSNELGLGHNRLSILDLSEDGSQPMHFGQLTIVFNGEIYNYIEIKNELLQLGHQFKSSSDTEVILHAYQQWGRSCTLKFMGMWSFALWDASKQELFCSRDRFGIKPFYYWVEGNKFYFGSEYKVFNAANLNKGSYNMAHLAQGLQMGWNHLQSTTYFERIQSLPAAHHLVYKQGEIHIERYWSINTTVQNTISFLDACGQYQQLFRDSIQLHMRSDVEVGCCLSGGLDSSSIASMVGTLFPSTQLKAFNVYYEGAGSVDERQWVKEVISKYPQTKVNYLTPSDEEIEGHFERAIYHADVPLAGSSPISQYFVMQLAAKHGVKVLLDGQGSDESLAGYMHSYYRVFGQLLKQMRPGAFIRQANIHASEQSMGVGKRVGLLGKSVLSTAINEQTMYAIEYKNYHPFMMQTSEVPFQLEEQGGTKLNQFLYHLNETTLLPSLLQFEDRNSMAFSIESRVPFLDHRLVEFAFSMPDHYKIDARETKRLLRSGMDGILPDKIRDRKDKKGFVTPGEVKWLRGPLKHLLDNDLQRLDGIINLTKAKQLIEQFKRGDNQHATMVWRLAVLNYWVGKN